MAGSDAAPAQRLTEGMAEWVAYRALGRMDLGASRSRRALARNAALEYVARTRGLDLEALATPERFIVQHQRIGTVLTYRLAFHLTDELVARRGFPSLVGYFRAFRDSPDEPANFQASFGVSSETFARETLDRLGLNHPAPRQPTASATTASMWPSLIGPAA